jgi:hypothetical protein
MYTTSTQAGIVKGISARCRRDHEENMPFHVGATQGRRFAVGTE